MALRHPVAAYNAANNVEAQLLCSILKDADIEAHVTEDISQVGVWMFGLLPEIHKPQVWIDQADLERAKPVLDDYERRQMERQEAEREEVTTCNAVLEADCEECGQKSYFPASQNGTTQYCSHCSAYVDVGDLSEDEPWWNEETAADNDE